MQQLEFLIADQGDGWWHCPSPLRCRVIDGPGPLPAPHQGDTVHWLVEVEPSIEWHGDVRYVERWGSDHPLCHPIEPTRRAAVLATASGQSISLNGDSSAPVSPVLNRAETLTEARFAPGLGMKVQILAIEEAQGASR